MNRQFTVYASSDAQGQKLAEDVFNQLKSRKESGSHSPDYTLYGLSNPKNGGIIFGELDGVIYKVETQSYKDKQGKWSRKYLSCEEISTNELNRLRSRFSK